jgi:hypothetical protein
LEFKIPEKKRKGKNIQRSFTPKDGNISEQELAKAVENLKNCEVSEKRGQGLFRIVFEKILKFKQQREKRGDFNCLKICYKSVKGEWYSTAFNNESSHSQAEFMNLEFFKFLGCEYFENVKGICSPELTTNSEYCTYLVFFRLDLAGRVFFLRYAGRAENFKSRWTGHINGIKLVLVYSCV